jgi:hypothetical protein
MTNFAPETGLAPGSFGIGTFRVPAGKPFPAIVQPDGSVHDVSELYHDTHAFFDDWDRALDTLVDLAAKGGVTPHQFAALEALPPLAHPNLLTGSPPGNGAMHGHFLNPGDVMDGEISFLGRQHNKIVAEDTQGRSFTYGKFQRA